MNEALLQDAAADTLDLLAELLDGGGIVLERGPLLETAPAPLPPTVGPKVQAMLLGVAIGDALGRPTESYPRALRRLCGGGEIRGYVGLTGFGRARGLPTDDTQMTFWTLEQLLEDGGRLVPQHLMNRFASSRIFGLGKSVLRALANHKVLHRPWYQCGVPSAGNGALMRISPVLVPHLEGPSKRLWADVVLAAMLTHNDRASTAACLAFTAMLWELLGRAEPPPAEWWWQSYVAHARELEGETAYRHRQGSGSLWQFVEEELPRASERGESVADFAARVGSTAYLLETVPALLYILTRHAEEPVEAVVRAVNDTHDNDTIGALVGAAMGALHGRDWLPEAWVKGLVGRTRARDDGRVFELIQQAARLRRLAEA